MLKWQKSTYIYIIRKEYFLSRKIPFKILNNSRRNFNIRLRVYCLLGKQRFESDHSCVWKVNIDITTISSNVEIDVHNGRRYSHGSNVALERKIQRRWAIRVACPVPDAKVNSRSRSFRVYRIIVISLSSCSLLRRLSPDRAQNPRWHRRDSYRSV